MEIVLGKKENLEKIYKKFKDGKTSVLLSDTIYGFSCPLEKKEAIDRIYKIKKRPKNKPFIFLLSDLKMLKKYFDINSDQEFFIKKSLGQKKYRPTTFILKPKPGPFSFFVKNNNEGVAVRLPKNDFLIKIIELLKQPLVSTSCNLSGEKSLNNLNQILAFFKGEKIGPDFIIKPHNERPKRRPSKIVDIRDVNAIKILRS